MDVMMESMSDGFDLASEVKNHSDYKDIPILLYTGIDNTTGLNFKSAFGSTRHIPADAFLEKPATSQALIEQVELLLSK
jgi:CheY-like chemotaxis protein